MPTPRETPWGLHDDIYHGCCRLCGAAFADNLFELQQLVENGIDANSGDYDFRTGE